MNKKGTLFSQYVPEWIYKAILLVIITVFVLFLVNMMTKVDVHAENLRAESFLSRVLYSPHGFSYVDPIGRVHAKTIDINKYKTNTAEPDSSLLMELVDYDDRQFIAAKFELINLDTNEVICPGLENADGTCSVDALYYNKELFDKWLIFSFDKSKFFKLDKPIFVKIWDGKWQKGRLNVEVVTPVG